MHTHTLSLSFSLSLALSLSFPCTHSDVLLGCCDYNPAGNYLGRFAENVRPAGTTPPPGDNGPRQTLAQLRAAARRAAGQSGDDDDNSPENLARADLVVKVNETRVASTDAAQQWVATRHTEEVGARLTRAVSDRRIEEAENKTAASAAEGRAEDKEQAALAVTSRRYHRQLTELEQRVVDHLKSMNEEDALGKTYAKRSYLAKVEKTDAGTRRAQAAAKLEFETSDSKKTKLRKTVATATKEEAKAAEVSAEARKAGMPHAIKSILEQESAGRLIALIGEVKMNITFIMEMVAASKERQSRAMERAVEAGAETDKAESTKVRAMYEAKALEAGTQARKYKEQSFHVNSSLANGTNRLRQTVLAARTQAEVESGANLKAGEEGVKAAKSYAMKTMASQALSLDEADLKAATGATERVKGEKKVAIVKGSIDGYAREVQAAEDAKKKSLETAQLARDEIVRQGKQGGNYKAMIANDTKTLADAMRNKLEADGDRAKFEDDRAAADDRVKKAGGSVFAASKAVIATTNRKQELKEQSWVQMEVNITTMNSRADDKMALSRSLEAKSVEDGKKAAVAADNKEAADVSTAAAKAAVKRKVNATEEVKVAAELRATEENDKLTAFENEANALGKEQEAALDDSRNAASDAAMLWDKVAATRAQIAEEKVKNAAAKRVREEETKQQKTRAAMMSEEDTKSQAAADLSQAFAGNAEAKSAKAGQDQKAEADARAYLYHITAQYDDETYSNKTVSDAEEASSGVGAAKRYSQAALNGTTKVVGYVDLKGVTQAMVPITVLHRLRNAIAALLNVDPASVEVRRIEGVGDEAGLHGRRRRRRRRLLAANGDGGGGGGGGGGLGTAGLALRSRPHRHHHHQQKQQQDDHALLRMKATAAVALKRALPSAGHFKEDVARMEYSCVFPTAERAEEASKHITDAKSDAGTIKAIMEVLVRASLGKGDALSQGAWKAAKMSFTVPTMAPVLSPLDLASGGAIIEGEGDVARGGNGTAATAEETEATLSYPRPTAYTLLRSSSAYALAPIDALKPNAAMFLSPSMKPHVVDSVVGMKVTLHDVHCTNGVKDGNEMGVDCGPSCGRPCAHGGENGRGRGGQGPGHQEAALVVGVLGAAESTGTGSGSGGGAGGEVAKLRDVL